MPRSLSQTDEEDRPLLLYVLAASDDRKKKRSSLRNSRSQFEVWEKGFGLRL